MNKTLTNLLIFAAGAVIGSAVTWKFVKTKYEKKADKEIASMRQYWAMKNREEAIERFKDRPESEVEEEESVVKEYRNYAERYTSKQLIKPETILEEEEEEEMPTPYIITPKEFSNSEYSPETLTYYADGVIEDDWGEIWSEDEIKFALGEDFASHFGEYEEDSVYVRNDYKEIDYEILRDIRKYSEIKN